MYDEEEGEWEAVPACEDKKDYRIVFVLWDLNEEQAKISNFAAEYPDAIVYCYTSIKEYESALSGHLKDTKIFLVISGSLGQNNPQLFEYANLVGAIIFCNNLELHSKWAEPIDIILKVCKKFSSVQDKIVSELNLIKVNKI